MLPKVYIIIVTYNGINWIKNLLEKLKNREVIIVDNNSTDGTPSFIENNFSKFVLIKQKENIGFGRANNIGISLALIKGASHVFLLNQDAWFEKGCLEQLISIQKKYPKYGILSPIHLNGDGDKLDRHFSTYMGYHANPNFFSDHILRLNKKEVYEIPFVNAAGWLVSRDCLETVGGFDPIFFHYGEDQNYCQRVRFHGFKVGVVPNCYLYHDREERIDLNKKKDQKQYFLEKEKEVKIRFADINHERISLLEEVIQKQKGAVIKSTVKLKFQKALFYRKELHILRRCLKEIQNSIERNRKPAPNYLTDIDDL